MTDYTDLTVRVPHTAHRAFLDEYPDPRAWEPGALANPTHFLHAEALLRKALRENPPPPETVHVEAGQRRRGSTGRVRTVLAVADGWVWVCRDDGLGPWSAPLADVEKWPLVESDEGEG